MIKEEVAGKTATQDENSYRKYSRNTNSSQPFTIGLNPRVINKSKKHAALNGGFVTLATTLEELAAHVKNGYAIAGDFSGWRSKKNYLGTQTLFLDYDGGASLDDVLADPFISQYAALIYTSASHGKEGKDRFRVIFVCPKYLPKEKAISVQKQLALRFPKAAPESATYSQPYYGNTNALFPLKQDVRLPEHMIDDLEEQASQREAFEAELRKERKAAREAVKNFAGAEGLNRIEKALLDCLNVIPPRGDVGEGRYIEIRNIGYALRSFFGADKAYKVLNRWSPEEDSDINWRGIVYGTERAEGDISYEYVFNVARKYGWKRPRDLFQFDFEADLPVANETVCQRYLEAIPSVPEKIIGIVSPTGTGKSVIVQRFLETLDAKDKTVLVYHRRTLANQTARRSNGLVTLYEEVEDFESFGGTVAITVDSLHKLNAKTFKGCNVILDETGSIVRHLRSSSTIKNQKQAFDALYLLPQNATKIICLESGLSKATLEVVKRVAGANESYVVRNTYREDKGTATFYEKAQDVLNVATEKLGQNKRIAIAVDGGEATVTKYAKVFRDQHPDKKIYEVYAETSPNFTRFLENPDLLRFEEVDVLIYSPSLFEGADVSFTEDAYFDAVFLLREHGHILPEGLAQALDRVRDIKDREIHIFCSEALGVSSTSASTIYNEWQQDRDQCINYMEPDAKTCRHEFSQTYASIFKKLAAFEARSNMTGRCVVANLQTLLKRKGYSVVEASAKPEEIISKETIKAAKREIEAAKIKNILTADDISESVAKSRDGQASTERERNEVEKYYLKKLNGDSEDGLEYVVRNRKTIRETVYTLEQQDMTIDQLKLISEKRNQNAIDGSYKPLVDKALLRQKGIELIGGWNYTEALDSERFANWFRNLGVEARRDLGIFKAGTPKDNQKILGVFLASMGLQTVRRGKHQKGKPGKYYLDPHQQEQLHKILTRRRNWKVRREEEVREELRKWDRVIAWE